MTALLDDSFDTDGILYSGYLPAPEADAVRCGEPMQKPLTELEQTIKERWHARKDPINWLLLRCKYANLL